jgi:hypothetical protein
MKDKPLPVNDFNRELDRAARGAVNTSDDITPQDERALKLARILATADFSGSSAIRQSLRRSLAERSAPQPILQTRLNRFILFRDGRALAGTGIAVLLVFVWVFGLLAPQRVSATPAYTTLAATGALPGSPSVTFTVAVTHNQDIIPKPVPTPMAISVSTGHSATLPLSTPIRTLLPLGDQFPIVTTTISK